MEIEIWLNYQTAFTKKKKKESVLKNKMHEIVLNFERGGGVLVV